MRGILYHSSVLIVAVTTDRKQPAPVFCAFAFAAVKKQKAIVARISSFIVDVLCCKNRWCIKIGQSFKKMILDRDTGGKFFS
jgi:hypothetical protein